MMVSKAPRQASPGLDLVQTVATDREKTTLAQTVYERLKDDIFEFHMAPGRRYTEQELADRLGVSRTPLRFALHVLAREGSLQRVSGHACWQVPEFDLAYYEDLYDFRTLVELAGNREMLRTHRDLTERIRIRIIRRLDFIEPGRIHAAYDEHAKILGALLAHRAGDAEMLIRAHIGASRVEIRHITLHRLSLASRGGESRS